MKVTVNPSEFNVTGTTKRPLKPEVSDLLIETEKGAELEVKLEVEEGLGHSINIRNLTGKIETFQPEPDYLIITLKSP